MHNLKHSVTMLAVPFFAIVTCPASAEESVKFGGTIDLYAGSLKNAGDTGKTTTLNSGGLTTSYVGVSGYRDLSPGVQANFNLGAFFRADTGSSGRFNGDTFWARDANIGLTGKYGSISAGRGLSPNLLPLIFSNPFGGSFAFSPLVIHSHIGIANGTGWANSLVGDDGWSKEIIYTTPEFNGLKANLHYQFGGVSGDSSKRNIGFNTLYSKGALSLNAFYQNVRLNNPVDSNPGIVQSIGGFNASEQKAWFIGGGYDFGPAKIFASYDRVTHDVAISDKTASLGASVPANGGKFMIGLAQTKRQVGVAPSVTRTTTSVGYEYPLFDSTDVYAIAKNDRLTGFSNGNSFAVGGRYKF